MANSATAIWDGFRHPRNVLRHWVRRQTREIHDERLDEAVAPSVHHANSTERLERIAAYARTGYFHVEYTAGMFVVPLDIPPE
ncbi:hypothetical protein ABH945_006131 [Paraburkholderia sp. GAS333]|uniref:hypothetical protein n=1 Tax=Paraburkholderia sp. GAS333 TaxID=3156279 RepID=UPI003D1968C7